MLEMLTALPVMASVVGARSAGALDNASGVATVLRAVELLARDVAVGVVLTSAEELGLAGARAWAREATPRDARSTSMAWTMTERCASSYSGHAAERAARRASDMKWPSPVAD